MLAAARARGNTNLVVERIVDSRLEAAERQQAQALGHFVGGIHGVSLDLGHGDPCEVVLRVLGEFLLQARE
jgi:hypothetical protein